MAKAKQYGCFYQCITVNIQCNDTNLKQIVNYKDCFDQSFIDEVWFL